MKQQKNNSQRVNSMNVPTPSFRIFHPLADIYNQEKQINGGVYASLLAPLEIMGFSSSPFVSAIVHLDLFY